MSRTRIGLDIGATAVRAAEVTAGGRPGLIRAAQVPVPPGAVEGGEVRRPDAVAESIRELWRHAGFKSRQVYMAVGNQRVVVREVVLPWLPEKELRDSLPYQVQEFIPIPVDEAVLDFDVLEQFEHDGSQMLRVLLVAAQRAMVDSFIEVARMARLEPLGLDLVPFALLRAVATTEGAVFGEPGEEAVIDVGADVTSICVHDQGVPRFVRILPAGGNDVTEAVSRALGISFEEAEWLKRGETVEGGGDPVDARRVAAGRAASFVDEIRSSLEFYAAQTPGARVARARVTGGGSRLVGFAEMLEERLGVDVAPGRPLDRLQHDAEVAADAEPLLAVAVGLAMDGGKA